MSRPGAASGGRAQFAARATAIVTIALVAVALALVVLRGGDDRYEVTAVFANASQLVGGEMVSVGGVAAGSVERVELAADHRALVTFSVEEPFAPLREGTVATVRSTSLAGVANRRLELILPGQKAGAPIADGATIEEESTVSEVDLDALFNTLDRPTVRNVKRLVRGLERAGRGVSAQANRGLRYLSPALSTSRRVLAELSLDRAALRRLLVDTSQLSGTLADRAPEISQVVANLSAVTSAIGRQRRALTAAISEAPEFLREANTTLVNLRAAAEDLDPLLVDGLPVAERLGPVLADLRAVARAAVPTVGDLGGALRRQGSENDLTELARLLPAVADRALADGAPECGEDPAADYGDAADGDLSQGALGEARCALRNSLPILAHFRPYTPELVGWFDDFSTSGTLDASGGIARIAGTFNAFSASSSNGLPDLLSPVDPTELFGSDGSGGLVDVGNTRRCPGANERDPGDGSTPFTDGGSLSCDPAQLPVGP